ncbi:hypothetical protein RFI_12817 [Reticulomyxa filosa]|uniref:RRM domain-containing protein n=1 Tax=Reticulomyxa filosa TaxID=46433 RepID=X6NEF2_RETFI|nr:hypothetical protein RFI_12817 [Reticulomyxa filosa]|eukprot:ETO24341.1 hypothetical protein RFI_12817 [Reticulomyxa filosa]
MNGFRIGNCAVPTKMDPVVEINSSMPMSMSDISNVKNNLKEKVVFTPSSKTRTYSFPIPIRPPYCVWLGNMPSVATNKDVIEYLGKIGITIKDIRWGRRQGAHTCCYVDFHHVDDMKKVLETVDATNAPPFMCRQLKIDINEGIRVDRKSAVTAVTRNPLKNKTNKRSPSNDDIYVTATRTTQVTDINPSASQSASCLLNFVVPRRKD